jgi:hypothetical protein
MRGQGEAHRRPVWARAAGGALLVVVIAAVAAIAFHGSSRDAAPSAPAPTPPGPILNPGSSGSTAPTADLTVVRATARRFLASYLPVLYGRRPASAVRDADAHVTASLRAAARQSRAPRDRHPRVTGLVLRSQTATTVLAIATIDDDVSRPYRIVFSLTAAAGSQRWRVSELANY